MQLQLMSGKGNTFHLCVLTFAEYFRKLKDASIFEKIKVLQQNWQLIKSAKILGPHAQAFYELMTAPTTKILDKW